DVERAGPKRDARGDGERHSRRREVGTDAEFRAFLRPYPYEPVQARDRDALIEAAEKDDPFIQCCHTTRFRVELSFELPSKLRDGGTDADVPLLELLDDSIAQHGDTETRPGEAE